MTSLPRFALPPVVEVALSVMVEPIAFRAAHIGLLWNEFRTEFPKTQDQTPLDDPQELEIETRSVLRPSIQFEPVPADAPPLRTWFLNDDETQLLQIQHNRIARNWRRANTSASYPSYQSIRKPFQDDLEKIARFFSTNGIATELVPKQCEVTYVNHIVAGEGWESHADIGNVLVTWQESDREFLPRIEDARMAWRYIIRLKGSFLGRLHVSLQPAYRTQEGRDGPIFVLTLTARGKPLNKTIEGALEFLDIGHEWIVRGFAELTTPMMREKVWQQQS
jgi:uncharacterized protein (TIGR04255 family)